MKVRMKGVRKNKDFLHIGMEKKINFFEILEKLLLDLGFTINQTLQKYFVIGGKK